MAHEDIDVEASERLEVLVDDRKWDELLPILTDLEPADVADFLEALDDDDRAEVFSRLDLESKADALVEMETSFHEDILEEMPTDLIADIAEQMAPDDSADMLEHLKEDKVAEVLAAMEPEERREILPLLNFDEDSAGHIMTPEMCMVPPSFTVDQTRRLLASAEETDDPIFYVYIAAPADKKLLGLVSLKDLFLAPNNTKVIDLADTDYIFVNSNEDQQEVALKFRKYDIWVMPVVDDNHCLIGRITVDDIVDVIHEEADEDLAHMIGAPDIETEEDAPVKIAWQRLPWLMITMFAGLVNSFLIKQMIDTTNVAMIAIFVPAILAMGGNTGMQSSAIAVRGIALGQKKYSRLSQLVMREMSVGLVMGLVCGILTGLVVGGVLAWFQVDTGGVSHISLALAVGSAMGNAMVFASSFGVLTPVVLDRLGIDPAIASGPFVTTSNDLSAACIYWMTCLVILNLF